MSRVDFHSHILPGIDDGSAGVEESLAMLRLEAEQGIKAVVATPHFYPRYDSPERFLRRRAEAEKKLMNAMAREQGLPQVVMGAEVYFFSGISESGALLELTIGKKQCILIEMPQVPWTNAMYRELEGIHEKLGLTPVIAHVDRYISPLRTYGIPERLAELPVLVQANAEFFTRRATARLAVRLLREEKLHLLGSDCHNMRSRKPDLGEAITLIEKKTGNVYLDRISRWEDQVLSGGVVSV